MGALLLKLSVWRNYRWNKLSTFIEFYFSSCWIRGLINQMKKLFKRLISELVSTSRGLCTVVSDHVASKFWNHHQIQEILKLSLVSCEENFDMRIENSYSKKIAIFCWFGLQSRNGFNHFSPAAQLFSHVGRKPKFHYIWPIHKLLVWHLCE